MIRAADQLSLLRKVLSQREFCLIILDACRLDYFMMVYRNYLPEGNLIGAWSPASETLGWLKAVFTGRYDLVYVSANAFVNSKAEVRGFDARRHFSIIVDVWDWGWDEFLGTVPPWEVNKAALKYIYPRMVVHYVQPHGPWIGEPKLTKPWKRAPQGQLGPDYYIIEALQRGEITPDRVRQAYLGNLKLVLHYVRELIPKLPHNKIIVTADHGELLGEYDKWLHWPDLDYKELRLVPWYEVKR